MLVNAFYALFIALTAAYLWLMREYSVAWRAAPTPTPTRGLPDEAPRISVIVPARNEAACILECLQSIKRCRYPAGQLEILVVDDHSTDATPRLAGEVDGVTLISLSDHLDGAGPDRHYKKLAIETAVRLSTGEIIACTDADCLVPVCWLEHIARAFRNPGIHLVTGPVLIHGAYNLLQRFQALDLLGLMGITASGIQRRWHYMGNGANLAYRKDSFLAVGGYRGDRHASGDDMFLMQRMAARYPDGIIFLKDPASAVVTRAEATLPAFVQQRIRWGTKNKAMSQGPMKASLALVFVLSWSTLLCAGLSVVWPGYGIVFAPLLAARLFADYRFLRHLAEFFGQARLLRYFLPAAILHLMYLALIGALSLGVKRYTWKGRRAR